MAIFNKRKYIKPEMKTTGLGYHLKNIKKMYTKFNINLGALIFHYFKHIFKSLLNTVKTFTIFTCIKSFYLLKKLSNVIKHIFIRMLEQPEDTVFRFSGHYNEQIDDVGLFKAMGYAIKNTWSKRKILSSIFNYIAPVVSVAFLITLISYGSKQSYVLSVECNGKLIGYVDTEATAQEAEQALQERIKYVDDDTEIKIQPKLEVLKASHERPVSDPDEIANNLIKSTDVPFVECYGFYINGQFNGAINDKSSVENLLNKKLSEYQKKNPEATVSFIDDFEFKSGFYLENGLIDAETLCSKLDGYKQSEGKYKVVRGDTFTGISQQFGIPVSELMAMNPKVGENLAVGQELLVNRAKPFISVEVVKTEKTIDKIPFARKTKDNPDQYKSYSKTIQAGKNGERQVFANVTYIDDEVVKKDIISAEILKKPVDQIVEVGSKKTENFLWPTTGANKISAYYGYTSAYFGGSTFHAGIDISCPTGTHVKSVMSGTVTCAAWSGDYGYLVVIDHGNGYSTYYAHNSYLNVRKGQYVDQGTWISNVGSTGRSTGPHLHFEVRMNGKTTNPMNYKYVY